jgi:hypothetical protein
MSDLQKLSFFKKPDAALLINGWRAIVLKAHPSLQERYLPMELSMHNSICDMTDGAPMVKVGASNVFNNKHYETYGGPSIGRMAYVQITKTF